jgi:hypothetical protein
MMGNSPEDLIGKAEEEEDIGKLVGMYSYHCALNR